MISLDQKLESLKHHAEQNWKNLPAHTAGSVLIFSVSDGDKRALVKHVIATEFQEAWKQGTRRIAELARKRNLKGLHLRVDWMVSCAEMTWARFNELISGTKRTYFRFGFSLDKEFTYIFTEMECNANAVYYGSTKEANGRFNETNFYKYLKTRYNTVPKLPDDQGKIWVFNTTGAYCGPDAKVHVLPPILAREYGILGRGLYAGYREITKLTPDLLRNVVSSGTKWLTKQILPSGKFVYGYFSCFDKEIPTYNTLRHVSSIYSLLDVVDFLKDDSGLPDIERSLAYAAELMRTYTSSNDHAMTFLVDDDAGEIKLGANGTALLAFAKHAVQTGSTRYMELMRGLAEGIIHLQDQNTGAFTHVLHSDTLTVKDPFRIIYYDGEAVFGLLRLYSLDKNPRWLEAAKLAFEFFLHSEKHLTANDHWLSYAANEISSVIPDERYFAFGIENCQGFLNFMLQRETTYPTLLELLMAARKLVVRAQELGMTNVLEKLDLEKFKKALHYRAHYLLNGFFWPELAMFYQNPNRIMGSFFIRHHAFRTRIDDAQHYLSGLAAYGSMLEEHNPEWVAPENPRLLGNRYAPKE